MPGTEVLTVVPDVSHPVTVLTLRIPGLQLQLGLGLLPGEVDGEVEADVVGVGEQGDLETAE